MEYLADLARVTGGIGIFVLGMKYLEENLRHLAGRSFKLFLRHHAQNKLKGLSGGMVATLVLQSSSVVNLMILAFVGSGVLSLRHALAVVLGSNIGTTLDSWVVALAGFRYDLELYALPVVGICALGLVLSKPESKRGQWFGFGFGLAALFLGLNFIKAGFLEMVGHFDLQILSGWPVILFVGIGFVATALIQSSSAMVAIVLGALNAGVISFLPATAMILGSEAGTTVKLILAASGSTLAGKRLAYANFFYNAITIVLALFFLRPINTVITDYLKITDVLVALVFFQTCLNLAGALLFFPFIEVTANWLEQRFQNTRRVSEFLDEVPPESGELAIEALQKETGRFIRMSMMFICRLLNIPETQIKSVILPDGKVPDYATLKFLHGEIHAYSIRLRKELKDDSETDALEQLTSALRNAMFAAKSFHDSESDIHQFRNSSNDEKFAFYERTSQNSAGFLNALFELLGQPASDRFSNTVQLYHQLEKDYNEQLTKLYLEGIPAKLNESEISTLLNFNRELFSGYKALIWAVKDFALNKQDAAYFSELPGFIR